MNRGWSRPVQHREVDDHRFGAALRALRIRSQRTQVETAARAGVSRATISRIESGRVTGVSIAAIRRVAATLDARADLEVRWRGPGLDRLLDERHAALQQHVVRMLTGAGWACIPEASFSRYGERGSIDVFALHPPTRAILVVELKSELVDCQDLLRTMDQRRRLAPAIARERGWSPGTVSVWVALEARDANRRRVHQHADLFAAAYPANGRQLRRWLPAPDGPIRALSFIAYAPLVNTSGHIRSLERVRRPGIGPPQTESGAGTASKSVQAAR